MIHPTDQRYLVKDLIPFFSEEGFLKYKIKVEKAYVHALNKIGVCSDEITQEILAQSVTIDEVKEKEAILKHDIRALVEALRDKISNNAKPYVHLGLTSYDVVNTAQALLIKDATTNVVLPKLVAFELELIRLAREEKNTIQIGRTHGQHAEPTTFGKEIAVNGIKILPETSSEPSYVGTAYVNLQDIEVLDFKFNNLWDLAKPLKSK